MVSRLDPDLLNLAQSNVSRAYDEYHAEMNLILADTGCYVQGSIIPYDDILREYRRLRRLIAKRKRALAAPS